MEFKDHLEEKESLHSTEIESRKHKLAKSYEFGGPVGATLMTLWGAKRDNIVQLYMYGNKKYIYVNQNYIRQPKIYVRQRKIYVRQPKYV